MAQNVLAIDVGLEIDGMDGTITQCLNGIADPTVNPGVEAPISSNYTRSVSQGNGMFTITVFDKIGPLDTDWLARVSSASTGSLDTIGTPDDITYNDGLFGWTPATKIANAVDDVNEFLALMAPPAAPPLSNIVTGAGGVTGKLSFDNTHTITGYAYDSTLINATVQNSGNNLGIFNGSTTVSGILNNNVAASGALSFPAKAFGNGDNGTLQLWLNGALIHTTPSLATFVSGATGTGAFFTLSAATACQFSNGNAFPALKYRTGTFTIGAGQQRFGYNLVEVKHVTGSGTTLTTNQFYWYNSMDVVAISATGLTNTAVMGTTRYLSGVQYYNTGTITLTGTVNNAYADVYSASATAVSYSSTQAVFTNTALPTTTTNTATYSVNSSGSLSNSLRLLRVSASVSVSVLHPVKATYTSAATASGTMLYDPIVTSNALVEDFNIETYRISTVPANSYTAPTAYDATENVVTTSGLQYYNGQLRYPTGDFRSVIDSGTIQFAPNGNPNYTGATGTKTFIRVFQNTTGATKANFKLNITGSSTTFSAVGALSGNNLSVEMKFPQGSLAVGTGWMDAYNDFATSSWADGQGCRAGSYGNGRLLATDWGITVGTQSIAANERVYLRFTAPASWTGYLDTITLTWI